MKKKRYIAAIEGGPMSSYREFRFVDEDHIKDIRTYGDWVTLYELASPRPLSARRAKELGLKYFRK